MAKIRTIEFNWGFSEKTGETFYSYSVGEEYPPIGRYPGGIVEEVNERIKGGKLYYEAVFVNKGVVARIKLFNPNRVILFE